MDTTNGASQSKQARAPFFSRVYTKLRCIATMKEACMLSPQNVLTWVAWCISTLRKNRGIAPATARAFL